MSTVRMRRFNSGMWRALFWQGLAVIVAIFSQPSGLLDAALYAVLGLVLRRKKSRIAAVIAVTLMSAGMIVSMMRVPVVGALTIILYELAEKPLDRQIGVRVLP